MSDEVARISRDPRTMRAARDTPVTAVHAGRVRYATAWDWQRDLVARRAAGEVGDVLLTLEHDKVYTLGRRADAGNILLDAAQLEAEHIDVVEVDRGGDVTYHGPGQLIGYPIMQLTSTRGSLEYVRALEQIGIDVCASYGITAGRQDDLTGVWVDDAKVMAIGVRISAHGITQHGIGLNVSTDLGDFAGIVPCGIQDKAVCSLTSLGVDTDVADATTRFRAAFADVFATALINGDLATLDLVAAPV